MKWEKYREKFLEFANSRRISLNDIYYYLDYAKVLHDNKLPIIFDTDHFSKLVGYSTSYIERSIKKTYFFYRHYKIPKKNGRFRKISEPLPSLKEIQKWILQEILYKRRASKYAKAYVKNRNLKSNAVFHQNKPAVLTIDINNFFDCIKREKVYELFRNMGYNDEVSSLLSRICTLMDSLPQGAPTSPCISNLIVKEMDNQIGNFCRTKEIHFTRYSDDLTFSGNNKIGGLVPFVEKILFENGFEINKDKFRIRRRNELQEVTGITVNKKLQSSKKVRRKFRQDIHYIKSYGLESHLNHIESERDNYLSHLMGIGNFICFINPNDIRAKEDLKFLKKMYNEMKN